MYLNILVFSQKASQGFLHLAPSSSAAMSSSFLLEALNHYKQGKSEVLKWFLLEAFN